MSDPGITALVLCGGLGTRLRSVVSDVPKALARIGGEPFIGYLIRYLVRHGVRDIVLCTGFGAEQLAAYCGDGSRWGAHIRHSVEPSPLGTGGALKNAVHLAASDPVLVVNGDSFVNADVAKLRSYHLEKAAHLTIVVTEVADQSRYGGVRVARNGAVEGFNEKDSTGPGWINAGMYLMDRAIIESIPSGRMVSLERDVLPRYIGNGGFAMEVAGTFIDIGTPESYAAAETVLAEFAS